MTPTPTLAAPTVLGSTVTAAIARGAMKVYGTGDTEVIALDNVDFAGGGSQLHDARPSE